MPSRRVGRAGHRLNTSPVFPRSEPPASPSRHSVLAAYRRVTFLDFRRNRRSELTLQLAKLGLYWQALRVIGRHVVARPKLYAGALALLLLSGVLGSLAAALAVFCAAGWVVLGLERRGVVPAGEKSRPGAGWRGKLRARVESVLTERRCYAAALATAFVLGALLPYTGRHNLAGALGVVTLATLVQLRTPPGRQLTKWRSETQLLGLLLAAGVLRQPPAGAPALMLSRLGKPYDDDEGEHVAFELPGAVPWVDLRAKTQAIASGLGVTARRIRVVHPDRPDASEGDVVLSVLKPRPPVTVGGLHPLCSASTADATLPVLVGVDEDTGDAVHEPLEATNALTAGIMGSGKTWGRRPILATYLLDPRAIRFGGDGKGARDDYASAARLFRRWVWGTDEDAPEQLLAMLREVLQLVRDRNEAGRAGRPVDGWAPVVLWLEELQDFDAGMTKAEHDELWSLLGRIVRMGRAVRVHLELLTQQTSVDDVPGTVRRLLSTRTIYLALEPVHYAMALALSKLPVRQPRKVGQAVLRLPGSVHALGPYVIPEAEWEALCERAFRAQRPQLEKTGTPLPAGLRPLELTAAPTLVEPPRTLATDDPLLAAVRRQLAAGPLPAAVLYGRLPAELQPKDPRTLGVALRAYPDALEKKSHKGSPAWWLRGPSSTLAPSLVGAPAGPSHEGQDRPRSASTGTREGQLGAERSLP